jgi:signal transduction histidine kinase/CheY-like chemotaxis protein
MKLHSRLYLLVAGTVVPLVALAVVLGILLVDHERANFQRLAMDRNRAFMTAVDAELRGHITTLHALAANSNLEAGDLRAFHKEAQRALKGQPDWENLVLADPAGRELLAGVRPFGESLPEDPDRDSLVRAVDSRVAAIGSIRRWPSTGRYAVPIRVPVVDGPRVTYVLTALISPRQFEQMIDMQNLPTGWVTGLVDSTGHFIARVPTRSPADMASRTFMSHVRAAPEGWFRGTTVDGLDTFSAHVTSRLSGWHLGFAVPAELVFASALRYGTALAIGTLAAVLLAFAFAWWMSRRITRPIATLAAAARDLGADGRTGGWLAGTGIEEVRDVQSALETASAAIRERETLQQREQVALKAADRAKDEFLAMLGHELRNPLSAITTSSHVLRAAPPGSRMHTQAQAIIERQARQMARLVEDLLDISRLTMGKVALQAETFDLAQLAAVLVQTWEQSGRVAPGRIRVETVPAWVEADRARIEQVVANLLDNANRFTPADGSIHLRVRAEEGKSIVEVADEGAGIAPEMLERIFKPFTQAPQGPERSHGGLGLGLAVVRRLIEMHGGLVAVSSGGDGKGATFTITLPAAEAPEKSEPRTVPIAAPPPSGLRVLVVEDSDDARDMMHAMLTLHGHDVRTAASGGAGLVEAERFSPDVALLDIGLPDMDGYEVARRLRARESGSTIRLVALTGYGQSQDEAAAYAAGFDVHMTKPVAPEALARSLAELAASRPPEATPGE